jgi:hypothetical protein
VLGTATAELLSELARCDTADFVKLFGSPSRRHDRTSPAAADVSTVDTLPADTARHGEGRCEAVGRPYCKWRIRRQLSAWRYVV